MFGRTMSANLQLGLSFSRACYLFHWPLFLLRCPSRLNLIPAGTLIGLSIRCSARSRASFLPWTTKATRFPLPLPLISAGAQPTEPALFPFTLKPDPLQHRSRPGVSRGRAANFQGMARRFGIPDDTASAAIEFPFLVRDGNRCPAYPTICKTPGW